MCLKTCSCTCSHMRLFTVHVEGAFLSCRMIILPSDVIFALKCAVALVVTCICRVAGIIKQLLPLSEGDMTICSPSTGYIARAILPASGEQIVMSPSLKGNNCIIFHTFLCHVNSPILLQYCPPRAGVFRI